MNLALDIDTLYDDVKDYVTKGEQPCRLAGTEWLLESSLRDKPRRETMIIAASLAISLSRRRRKERKRKQPNVSRSRSVDKHYPFTRSSLTDKPIIRHSTLTRPTILSITAAGPPRGQKNETRDAALGEGSQPRRGRTEREREKRSAGVPGERAIIARNIIPG